jgi:tetratricopeptide (TPR) repeat protein
MRDAPEGTETLFGQKIGRSLGHRQRGLTLRFEQRKSIGIGNSKLPMLICLMDSFLAGLLGAVIATNQPAALSNFVAQKTGVSITVPNPNDPVEKEYQKLLAEDDASQAEVDKWIRDNQAFAANGAGVSQAELNRRIRERFESVRKAYEDFLKRHPKHVRARVAYGSFLGDTKDEEAAQEQWEKALKLDPNDPAVYNNLANIYGHIGPVKKAFQYYAKAIELNPLEPVYYHNFGTTVYLFRKDAREFYGIAEQEVFNKALELYSNAMKLDPTNFPLASDVAQTYYGIKPRRTEDALKAWTNALSIANDQIEREGVYIHFARIKLHAGRFDEARAHLNDITNEMYVDLKKRLYRNINELESEAKRTNSPPARAAGKPSAE